MDNKIIFTSTMGNLPIEAQPQPASKLIPEWYKNTLSYIGEEKAPAGDGQTTATIKRCMPVFDAINAGYLLLTYTDLWVSQREQNPEKPGVLSPWYEWPSFSPISFHSPEQAPLHPNATGTFIPKWINPWSIKTPPGYSSLFVNPFHRDSVFNSLPGVVDTDKYDPPVNIIFTLTDPNFTGLIPAGTPIVQVIPFQREPWKMELGTTTDLENQHSTTVKLRTKFFDSYKTQYRQIKEYR